jgi:hypothetical protein
MIVISEQAVVKTSVIKFSKMQNPKNPAGYFPENQIAEFTTAIMRRNYVVT